MGPTLPPSIPCLLASSLPPQFIDVGHLPGSGVSRITIRHDMDHRSLMGRSALHLAVDSDSMELVELLIVRASSESCVSVSVCRRVVR